MILHKKGLIFDSENNFISIKLNSSNNCCLYSLKALYKITTNYLLLPFFYAIISAYTYTQKS